MDSDSFFGFDATVPVDEELGDDDDYDALNDETFGSAAVGGDWEENHKQLSSLTESERLQRAIRKDVSEYSLRQNDVYHRNLEDLHNNEALRSTLNHLSLERGHDSKRLFERSLGSSPLINIQKEDHPDSSKTSNNIWSPTIGLDALENLRQLRQHKSHQYNAIPSHLPTDQQNFQANRSSSVVQDLISHVPSSFKTVSELEEELKRQHSNNPRTYTVEDLEREISRQAINARKINNDPYPSSFPSPRLSGSHFPNSLIQQPVNFPRNLSGRSTNSYPYNLGGNVHSSGQYQNPLLNAIQNKGMPPNIINNASHMASRPLGLFPHHHNQNQRIPLNRGFLQGGNNQNRNHLNRNNMDKRNFEQNFRFDQMRNSYDQREKSNNGHGGNRVRRDSDAEWEEWQRIRQDDEYAGLMTPRDKGWLRNIQAMQLQTENPYQDDYYFVMHNVKDQRKREEEVIEIDGLQLLLPDKGKEGKEYEPPKWENSLGKLQVASVNAPRKIIDLQVVHLDSSHPTTLLQRDMRKHRHLLLNIEKLYNIKIELDDLERKIRALPDCPTRDLFRSTFRQLVGKLWTGLTNPHESFVQLLCIRKGKTLAARLMTWVGQAEVEHLLATVIQNLSLLTKKDAHDRRLQFFWPIADRFFSISSASTLVSFSIMMTAQLKPQKNQFIPALSSKLGVSILFSLLIQGEVLWSELEKDEAWQQFLKAVVEGLSVLSSKTINDVQPLPSASLASSPRLPSSRLATCTIEGVDSTSLNRAFEVLKNFESHLMKNATSSCEVSSSKSSFNNVRKPQTVLNESQSLFSNTSSMSLKADS